MNYYLRSLSTANPSRYVTQKYVYDFIAQHFSLGTDEKKLYERVLIDGSIRGRYIGVEFDEQACEMSADQQNARFLKFGKEIAVAAAKNALTQAQLEPQDIGGLVVNTCTGYLCPGLSSYVAQELGLKNSIKVCDLMGMGCGAAIPNLETAVNYLARKPDAPVLSIAVEICSATMFMGPDADLIISNSIFGDGAAAAVVDTISHTASPALLRFVDFESALHPEYREHLRYRTEQGRLRNTLSKRVPVIAGKIVTEVCKNLLARHDLNLRDIDFWAIHPGGTAVLEQIGEKLDLPIAALGHSYRVFENFGNMSSPAVLFVLRQVLNERPKRGAKGMMLSFGAGFTAFAALVEFA